MLTTYGTGLLVIAVVAGTWVAAQNAWRRAFLSGSDDPDAMAARRCREDYGCSFCGCVSGEKDR